MENLPRDPSASTEGAEPSFEDVVRRLQEVVERLERGELALAESLAAFEEGVALARDGARRLDAAERRVEELLTDGASVRARPIEREGAP